MSLTATAPSAEHCQVVELRQYTLRPGARDTLVSLFDRAFLEAQEAVGLRVIGQFLDLDDADRFVWLRGFADMPSRAEGLQAFYGGPVWAAHRDEANATMIDSDDVLLLRPAWPGAALAGGTRAAAGAAQPAPGVLLAWVFALPAPAADAVLAQCRTQRAPELEAAGALQQGWYVSKAAPNNFPRLPVREGENVLVCFSLFASEPLAAKALLGPGGQRMEAALGESQAQLLQRLRLAPTARSALHA
jgi:hypothetical protein